MPRPSRCRRVCAEPLFRRFAPQAEEGACPNEAQPVVLAVDEYEVVRIVDLYKRSHEECARQMQVSRTTVTESGYIKSRFLDDKLSAAILLGLARAVAEGEVTLSRKVSLLFTVYEEVGHGGAFVPADTREMISVDMGCVGEGLSCTERQVSICAKDSVGPYSYEVVGKLIDAAKKMGADYAVDVYPHYGSDVDVTLRVGFDIRHGLIGAGVYASHGYERSHIDGVYNTLKVICGYLDV